MLKRYLVHFVAVVTLCAPVFTSPANAAASCKTSSGSKCSVSCDSGTADAVCSSGSTKCSCSCSTNSTSRARNLVNAIAEVTENKLSVNLIENFVFQSLPSLQQRLAPGELLQTKIDGFGITLSTDTQ